MCLGSKSSSKSTALLSFLSYYDSLKKMCWAETSTKKGKGGPYVVVKNIA